MSFIPSTNRFIHTPPHNEKTCKNGSTEPFLHVETYPKSNSLFPAVHFYLWCGYRESDPGLVLGKDAFYH